MQTATQMQQQPNQVLLRHCSRLETQPLAAQHCKRELHKAIMQWWGYCCVLEQPSTLVTAQAAHLSCMQQQEAMRWFWRNCWMQERTGS